MIKEKERREAARLRYAEYKKVRAPLTDCRSHLTVCLHFEISMYGFSMCETCSSVFADTTVNIEISAAA